MFERILILMILLLVSFGIIYVRYIRRLRHAHHHPLFVDLVPLGRPAVIGVATPFCTECHTRQAPALSRLAATLAGEATVRLVPVLDHPELMRRVGSLSEPATVVIDSNGQVRHLNVGYVSDDLLHEQLLEIER